MAIAQVETVGRLGMRCFPVTVEVDVSTGLPAFHIVGLPDVVVQEAKERIRAAIKNSRATFPLARITVNLAPADIKKEGVGFDLPIAVGILAASGQIPPIPETSYFYGELGLQGELRATRGVLPFLTAVTKAKTVFIPSASLEEATLAPHPDRLVTPTSLEELTLILKGEASARPIKPRPLDRALLPPPEHDFADINGQAVAKRALEIAAAGHHHILMSGPPGAGKTLLARALPSIMPPLRREELIEVMAIASVAGLLLEAPALSLARPFRSPHHSASLAAIVGGGTPLRPGEITLAHQGVLFLDEFAEFPHRVIEALRQPLEDRTICVARAGSRVDFPAHCLLVAAMNPCPCGFWSDPTRQCVCTPQQIITYRKKLSGPILDRLDLHVVVPAVPPTELLKPGVGERSEAIRRRVIGARRRQTERYRSLSLTTNSALTSKRLKAYCPLDTEANHLLEEAAFKLRISARGYYKVLKVARTIADLVGEEVIGAASLAEALQYRSPAP